MVMYVYGYVLFLQLQNGFTPLHIAAQRNQTDIGVAMLDHGVEPDIRTQVSVNCRSFAPYGCKGGGGVV